MKKLSLILVALLLCSSLSSMSALAETKVDAMIPALDSIIRAMDETDMAYSPRDPEFFWMSLYLMAVNWGAGHPLAVIHDDGEWADLSLPRMAVQELATALFADYDDLLPLPESMSASVTYDESMDAYRFALSDAGDTFTEIKEAVDAGNGSFTVHAEVKAYGEEDETLARVRFELAPNPYADGIVEPIYLFSVVATEEEAK